MRMHAKEFFKFPLRARGSCSKFSWRHAVSNRWSACAEQVNLKCPCLNEKLVVTLSLTAYICNLKIENFDHGNLRSQ